MNNISGFGIKLLLKASVTFPVGILLTQIADDSDPLDVPSQQVADKAMGGNGDLLVWTKATPININLSVVPAGDDDKNLAILLSANRASQGKNIARDVITLIAVFPDGTVAQYNKGAITDGMSGNSLASAGRLKSKVYGFTFESIS